MRSTPVLNFADTIQHNTIQYNTIQYNTIQYNTYILLDGLVCSIVGYFYESRRILASP